MVLSVVVPSLVAALALSGFASEMDVRFRASVPGIAPRFAPPTNTAHGDGARLSLRSLPSLAERQHPPDVLTATPSLNLYRTNWIVGSRGVPRVELSRADCALKGFGGGASLGLWLGALAMTTNMWDERTSWYVGGAAAAAGALLGGTIGVESDAWRTNYDWE
ncbi:MAG: hypothetical protein ACKVU1_05200 [bacterium]